MDSCEVIYLSTLATRVPAEEKLPPCTAMTADPVKYLRSEPAIAKIYDFQTWAEGRGRK